jgi:hypothetical protein
MEYQQCKHINLNTGLHCDKNGFSHENHRHGYCKQHYEIRTELVVESEGLFGFTNGACYNVLRGKRRYCTNLGVDNLLGLCQDCYDKLKEKRKLKVLENQMFRQLERETRYPQDISYDRVLNSYRTAMGQIQGANHLIANLILLYHKSMYDHLTLQQKRTIVDDSLNLFRIRFNITPVQEDLEAFIEWNGDEDKRIFHPRPVVRFVHFQPPQQQTALAQLAADNQNVHRTDVVTQTNTTVDKLLALAGTSTKSERTPDFFASRWLTKYYGTWERVRPIINDMTVWYNTSHCKAEGDWLYRKVLHGLYKYIEDKPKELRRELTKRAFEECRESVGQCCEGHIARLANVLVGFDEEAKPEVSVGELLQQKMAAIARKELSNEDKLLEAGLVLLELNIPEAQHNDWLQAF